MYDANFENAYLVGKGKVTRETLGDGIIQPAVLKKYIRDMIDNDTAFLKEACEVGVMNAESMNLPLLDIDGGFLHAGGSTKKNSDGEYITADYNVGTNEIVAKPFHGAIKYEDDAVDVSIEGENLGDTLTTLAAQQSKADVERISLYSDVALKNTNEDYGQFDGLVKNAGNKIYATDLEDQKTSTILQALINSLDNKYRVANKLGLYVSPALFDAYLDELIARNTNLGDAVLTDGTNGTPYIKFKGYKVYSTPSLGNPVDADGEVAIAVIKNNATVKWFKEMRTAVERKELDYATYVGLKGKFGANYKNSNAVSVCYITKANPSA